jgi:hypothetical protein
MTTQQKDLLRAIGRETNEGRGFVLPLHLDLPSLLMLCRNLQLALRNPLNNGPSAQMARECVDGVQRRLIDAGYFAHAELIEMGNNSALDEQPDQSQTTSEKAGGSR